MKSVKEADKMIEESLTLPREMLLHLSDAFGHTLAEDIVADRNYPPFDKSLMDGVAINFEMYKKGERMFKKSGIQQAGRPKNKLENSTECFEIMTGAVVPLGCDCVIPIENLIDYGDRIEIKPEISVKSGQYIVNEGSDCIKGAVVLKKGDRLTAPRIAFCASVGCSLVKVLPKVKIAVVSTGDELVAIDQPVSSHQIHSSNDFFIKVILESTNLAQCKLIHLRDDEEELKDNLKRFLSEYDSVVLTGGVSMGRFDLVPKILNELNVKCLFHKVAQRPGKPLWFGKTKDSKPVFALPGNPLSTYTCSVRFVRKHLLNVVNKVVAIADQDIECSLKITEYKMVKLIEKDGLNYFTKVDFNGSGDLIAVTGADGFIEIDEEMNKIKKGDKFSVYLW